MAKDGTRAAAILGILPRFNEPGIPIREIRTRLERTKPGNGDKSNVRSLLYAMEHRREIRSELSVDEKETLWWRN